MGFDAANIEGVDLCDKTKQKADPVWYPGRPFSFRLQGKYKKATRFSAQVALKIKEISAFLCGFHLDIYRTIAVYCQQMEIARCAAYLSRRY